MTFFKNSKISNSFVKIGLCLFLFIGLYSCNTGTLYQKEISIPDKKWFIDSTLVYEFDIKDTSRAYDIYYTLQNTIDYPFSNLYVCYYLEDEKKQVLDSLLQDITLMNSITGEPFGERSWTGGIYNHELMALPAYKFKKQGKLIFRLKQYMRQNPIPEILNIGIKIKVNASKPD